jgi:hypothetical protein
MVIPYGYFLSFPFRKFRPPWKQYRRAHGLSIASLYSPRRAA